MTDTPTLFDLAGEAGRLANRIDIIAADLAGDDPEAAAAAAAELEELINAQTDNQEAILAKANCWAWVIKRYRAMCQARTGEAARLAAMANADQAAANAMEQRLIAALIKVFPAETSFNLPSHRITSRSTEAVEITCDPEDLPEDCQRVKIEPDRTAIKSAIKDGTTVQGCQLVQRRSWKLS